MALGWTPLLAVKEEICEDLMRKCYANLKVLKDGGAMKFMVKRTTIILDEEILGEIIGARFNIDTEFFGNT